MANALLSVLMRCNDSAIEEPFLYRTVVTLLRTVVACYRAEVARYRNVVAWLQRRI